MFTNKMSYEIVTQLQDIMPFTIRNQRNILINYLPNCIFSGPKLEEVSIFWQMVMEQKPAVVVMLTKVEENGKVCVVFTMHTTPM